MNLELGSDIKGSKERQSTMNLESECLCSSSGFLVINCDVGCISGPLSPHFLSHKIWIITPMSYLSRLSVWNKNNRCKVFVSKLQVLYNHKSSVMLDKGEWPGLQEP